MTGSALIGALLLVASAGRSDAAGGTDDLVAGLADVCLDGITNAVTAPLAELRQEVAALRGRLEGPPTPAATCPHHWSRHGDSCYLIPAETRSWHAAHHACARLDRRARLASVHGDNSGHIAGLVSASGRRYVWIGLVRLSSTPSAFGWVDGSPLDVINWVPGEPTNSGNKEHCGHFYGPSEPVVGVRMKWNDAACSRSFHFLCQIKLSAW